MRVLIRPTKELDVQTYWTSPQGILQRARDKRNPYTHGGTRSTFNEGWSDAAGQTDRIKGRGAYARGWNARREYEATEHHRAHLNSRPMRTVITREQARDMLDAHGSHIEPGGLAREGCPECDGRSLGSYPTEAELLSP